MTRKIAHDLALTVAFLLLLSACGLQEDEQGFVTPLSNQADLHKEDREEAGEHTHLESDDLTAEVNVVMVPSELVIGPNRFAVGLFDQNGALIPDADVHFHYYDLRDPDQAVYQAEADARVVQDPEGGTTIYTDHRDFDFGGLWGVEVEIALADGSAAKQRLGFEVAAEGSALGPGDRAPGLNTATAVDVGGNLSLLTSASEPVPALHERSLAQALGNEEPTLLLLATPAFCQTRFCGPAYEMFADLQEQYGEQVNFVYAEVFDGLPDPGNSGFRPSAAAQAFRIESEPWAYLIDNQGIIVYRLEGLFTAAELEAQMQKWFDL